MVLADGGGRTRCACEDNWKPITCKRRTDPKGKYPSAFLLNLAEHQRVRRQAWNSVGLFVDFTNPRQLHDIHAEV